ncbi:MAG: pyruvate ferredoxin oxidoreductase [Candidatus Hodarchaeota archaeon]
MAVKKKILALNGDEAAAFAAKQCDPDVVAAYPITPQTIIVERFSEYVADGEVNTEFVAVESEHSALSACVGAAAVGGRAYTATASQGLALMWEILYIAAGLRLPIVMTVVNRALSAPINIHCDHSDSMGARDSGWIQIYCENSQEAYDTTIQAWRIAEHPKVQLPIMDTLDGFVLSHTLENVSVLPDEAVRDFIGEKVTPKVNAGGKEVPYVLDPDNPLSFGDLALTDYYFEIKMQQILAMNNVEKAIEDIDKEYGEISGRTYGMIEQQGLEDADVAILSLGSTAGTTRYVAKSMQDEGAKVGSLKLRVFRPFPYEKLSEALEGIKVVAVLDRSSVPGGYGGPVFNELRAIFYEKEEKPIVVNYIYGLGGRDVPQELIRKAFKDGLRIAKTGKVKERIQYLGVR